MFVKQIAIGVFAASLMAGTALAESASGEWRASKLVGLNVYNDSNEKLGSIDELLTGKDGKIDKVIIGVGGFLGVGQRDIAVNFDQLKFTDQPVPSATASTTSPTSSTSTTRPPTSPSPTVGTSSSSTTTTTTRTTNEWYPDHAVMAATKDQLKSMPEFTYDKPSK